jgi:hypothetical protein
MNLVMQTPRQTLKTAKSDVQRLLLEGETFILILDLGPVIACNSLNNNRKRSQRH